MHPDLNLWVISDGKPGHLNQSIALSDALKSHFNLSITIVPSLSLSQNLAALITRRHPYRFKLTPDAVIAAGHQTHLTLLAACSVLRAKSVVIMKPSLPASWFDFCIIPKHDGVEERSKILNTQGAINRGYASHKDATKGMILIGGPSSHHTWSDDDILRQIESIVTRTPDMRWHLTTSRRTPTSTLDRLKQFKHENLEFVPIEQTQPDWLRDELATTSVAWVSEDSVSMIYESLTSAASTGLIQCPNKGYDRIVRSVEQLVSDGWVSTFEQWIESQSLPNPRKNFNEAQRAADWLAVHLKDKH